MILSNEEKFIILIATQKIDISNHNNNNNNKGCSTYVSISMLECTINYQQSRLCSYITLHNTSDRNERFRSTAAFKICDRFKGGTTV
jgi:hypothetical protein